MDSLKSGKLLAIGGCVNGEKSWCYFLIKIQSGIYTSSLVPGLEK